MITIELFGLIVLINTFNQHKHNIFDPFDHSMCHCAPKFGIEAIMLEKILWLEVEEHLKWSWKWWFLLYSTNYVDFLIDNYFDRKGLEMMPKWTNDRDMERVRNWLKVYFNPNGASSNSPKKKLEMMAKYF